MSPHDEDLLRLDDHLKREIALEKMTWKEALEEQVSYDRIEELDSLPRSSWPDVAVKWDLSRDNFHMSMDGLSREQFERDFSVVLMDVDALSLRKNLVRSSIRLGGRFEGRYRRKTIELVAHLEKGGSVTPPIVKLFDGQIVIGGGHHRFWWARHKKQRRIPALVHSEDKLGALNLLKGVLI